MSSDSAKPKRAFERAGFTSEYSYRQKRKAAQAWSKKHSRRPSSQYDPTDVHKSPEAFGDYYRTFVSVDGTEALRQRKRFAKANRLVEKYYAKYGGEYGYDTSEIKRRYKMTSSEIANARG